MNNKFKIMILINPKQLKLNNLNQKYNKCLKIEIFKKDLLSKINNQIKKVKNIKPIINKANKS